jgi:dUTP pyrophosphatase
MAAIVKIKRDVPVKDIPLPSYATAESAGMDVRAAERTEIAPGERAMVRTGLRIEIPRGYEGQVRPRSGLAAKYGVTVLNSPGTIDSDYRGEILVILINLGKETFTAQKGDRVAQIIFAPCERMELAETDEIADSGRSSGGFGSTGIK